MQQTKQRKAAIAKLTLELQQEQNNLREQRSYMTLHAYDLETRKWNSKNEQLIQMKATDSLIRKTKVKSMSDVQCEYCWEDQMLRFKFDFQHQTSAGYIVP